MVGDEGEDISSPVKGTDFIRSVDMALIHERTALQAEVGDVLVMCYSDSTLDYLFHNY